jgi:HSP20 family protein
MAEAKTNRSDPSRERENALARRDREQGSIERRQPAAAWFSTPVEFMNRMSDEMDRTFDRLFRDLGMPRRSWFTHSPFKSAGEEAWAPRIEAFQKGDRFTVRAELPGLKKDDVQVEMTDDAITIRGERRRSAKKNAKATTTASGTTASSTARFRFQKGSSAKAPGRCSTTASSRSRCRHLPQSRVAGGSRSKKRQKRASKSKGESPDRGTP